MLSKNEEKWLLTMVSTGPMLPLDALHAYFAEALARWKQFHGCLPSSWPPVLGWTRIAGELEMPGRAMAILLACPPERRPQIARAYLAWNRHVSTRDHANPYEPLLSFLHHGGTWSRVENGILDIYDCLGQKYGIAIGESSPVLKQNPHV